MSIISPGWNDEPITITCTVMAAAEVLKRPQEFDSDARAAANNPFGQGHLAFKRWHIFSPLSKKDREAVITRAMNLAIEKHGSLKDFLADQETGILKLRMDPTIAAQATEALRAAMDEMIDSMLDDLCLEQTNGMHDFQSWQAAQRAKAGAKPPAPELTI